MLVWSWVRGLTDFIFEVQTLGDMRKLEDFAPFFAFALVAVGASYGKMQRLELEIWHTLLLLFVQIKWTIT